MSILILALVLTVTPAEPAPAASAAPRSFTSALPPIVVRNAAFRRAGILADLDRIGADDFDRDRLYLRAQSRTVAALRTLYPWMTVNQAVRLKRAVIRPGPIRTDQCAGCSGP